MAKLKIMADLFQIYLCDPAYNEDWSALWTDKSLDDRIVALAHTVVFGTGRNMPVPVDVAVHKQQPDLAALIAPADHAVAGGLSCSSGQLKVAGCTDYLPDAFTLAIAPGHYGVALLSFDLDTIDPVGGLDGNDRYALHIWPAATPPEITVLKRWKSVRPPRPAHGAGGVASPPMVRPRVLPVWSTDFREAPAGDPIGCPVSVGEMMEYVNPLLPFSIQPGNLEFIQKGQLEGSSYWLWAFYGDDGRRWNICIFSGSSLPGRSMRTWMCADNNPYDLTDRDYVAAIHNEEY